MRCTDGYINEENCRSVKNARVSNVRTMSMFLTYIFTLRVEGGEEMMRVIPIQHLI